MRASGAGRGQERTLEGLASKRLNNVFLRHINFINFEGQRLVFPAASSSSFSSFYTSTTSPVSSQGEEGSPGRVMCDSASYFYQMIPIQSIPNQSIKELKSLYRELIEHIACQYLQFEWNLAEYFIILKIIKNNGTKNTVNWMK